MTIKIDFILIINAEKNIDSLMIPTLIDLNCIKTTDNKKKDINILHIYKNIYLYVK